MVQNSRIIVLSPIFTLVFSPLNLRSWGISEIIADWKILQLFPIRAPDLITEDDLISVLSPISTSSSIITKGPIVTFFPIFALESIIAAGWILLIIFMLLD